MTGATEEGVCSTQPRRVNRLKNRRHGFDEAVMESGDQELSLAQGTLLRRLRMKGAPLEDFQIC